jgi:hypothetical protein
VSEYTPIKVTARSSIPSRWTSAQREVGELLLGCADIFAADHRQRPHRKFPTDGIRQPHILLNRGLGVDEAAAFLRAYRHGLVNVKPNGNFLIPNARACSLNLHLLSRNGDHLRVNTECLIHVGAYAELVLDYAFKSSLLIFDPFFNDDAMDLWGYAEPVRPGAAAWEGKVVLLVEAKARVKGGDSLSALLSSFEKLSEDPAVPVSRNHRRKWNELLLMVGEHGTLQLLLVADGARWWFEAQASGNSVVINRTSPDKQSQSLKNVSY